MNCLLCGGSAELKYKGYPGYMEPDVFDIYSCNDCDTSFSYPRVESDEIYNIIYKNKNYVQGYDRYWKYMRMVKDSKNPLNLLAKSEDVYWSVKEALSFCKKEKKNTTVLEIGSGLGYLTYSLHKTGYNIRGLDISANAVNQAVSTFGNLYKCANLFDYAKSNGSSFDIIIMTEVLEHVNEPEKFVQTILYMLKPEGYAILTTPNKSIFPSDIIWANESPPVHSWWFSEKSFEYLAGKYKVELNFVDFSNFFKKNYTAYNLRTYRRIPFTTPSLDSSGNLIMKKKSKFASLRDALFKVSYFKKTLTKIKHFFIRLTRKGKSEIIVSSIRGYILCAVLKKNRKDIVL